MKAGYSLAIAFLVVMITAVSARRMAAGELQYQIPNIAAGPNSLVGLKSDGKLAFDGGAKELGVTQATIRWTDVVQVAPGWHHLVALRKDGTVVGVAIKGYESAVAGISEWKGVVVVAAGYAQTLALKADRTVVAAGGNWAGQCNVVGWKDIVGIAAGMHSAGVRQDGTCVAAGSDKYGQRNVSDWRDIIAVAAGDAHTVGLKRDGTVVATGRNNMGQCNVGKWTDIVDIKSLSWQTIGLCKDGTVVTTGEDNWKQQTMNEAVKDAVAITSGEHFFAALRPDGTIFCAGEASRSRNAMNWNLGATPPSAYQVRNRGKGSVK